MHYKLIGHPYKILVAMPSLNEADNIANPTAQIDEGLRHYYPGAAALIMNCDNHSADGTEAAFLQTATSSPKEYVSTPVGILGKGHNLRNMLIRARSFDAGVVICIDADMQSVTPPWVQRFSEPILDGYDFVTPDYARHRHDGPITNHLCYPLIYGMFGVNIRQPIGGDFALSARMVKTLLEASWDPTAYEYGVDIFFTMTAITQKMRIASTGQGSKIHKPSTPRLGPMFIQVCQTLLTRMLRDIALLENRTVVETVPQYGLHGLGQPQNLVVDEKRILTLTIESFAKTQPVLEQALSPYHYSLIRQMFETKKLDIPAELWVDLVGDVIVGYAKSDAKIPILEALRTLYYARRFSHIHQMRNATDNEAEEAIMLQAKDFFNKRTVLFDRLTSATQHAGTAV